MKKFISCICAGALCISLVGCFSGEMIINNNSVNEWVSPDGVHYWISYQGNRGFMAPRYNHEGNLIIDNWEVQ